MNRVNERARSVFDDYILHMRGQRVRVRTLCVRYIINDMTLCRCAIRDAPKPYFKCVVVVRTFKALTARTLLHSNYCVRVCV